MDTKTLDTELKKALQEIQQEALPMLQGNIDLLGYQFRGTLRQGMKFTLDKKGDEWVLDLNIPGHGKVLDVKRYFAFGASVQDLTEWVQSKGQGKWAYVPGYSGSGEWPENWAYRIALGIQNTEQQYSGGASGGSVSKRQGSQRKRTVRFVKRQWLYTPYLSLWSRKRNKVQEMFLDIVHGDLLKDIIDTYDQSARSVLIK